MLIYHTIENSFLLQNYLPKLPESYFYLFNWCRVEKIPQMGEIIRSKYKKNGYIFCVNVEESCPVPGWRSGVWLPYHLL